MPSLASSRTFRHLWLGFTISELGTRAHYLAIAILAYQLTGSALGVSACFMAVSLSMVVVGPLAGVIIDRTDRKWLLVCASGLSALTVSVVPLSRLFHIVLLLEIALNCLLTFYYPVFLTVMPEIVQPKELTTANSLMATSTRLAHFLGPAVGALCISRWGVYSVFLLDALTFASVAWLVASSGFRPAKTAKGAKTGFKKALVQGLTYIRSRKLLKTLVFSVSIPLGCAVGINNALLYVFSQNVLQVGSAGYATLVSSVAVGLLAGSMIAPTLSRLWGLGGVLLGGVMVSMLGFAAFALSTNLLPAVGGRLLVGLGYSLYSISSVTFVQELTTSSQRGVVITVSRSVENVCTAGCLAAAGALADIISIRPVMLLASVVCVGGIPGAAFLFRSAQESGETCHDKPQSGSAGD